MHFFRYIIRLITPAFLCLLCIILSLIPNQIPYWSSFFPMFDLLFLYFWCVYRPQLMPLWFVFVLGIIQDAVYGTFTDSNLNIIMGTTSFILILYRTSTISQQKVLIKERFIMVWLGFLVLSLAAVFLEWLLFMIFSGQFYWSHKLLIQWAITVLLYPVLHVFNYKILQRIIHLESHA